MPATIWGPWEPYTQTVPFAGAGLIASSRVTLITAAVASASLEFDPIHLDPDLRTCEMAHVQAGSAVSFSWVTGSSACPAIVSGTHTTSSGVTDYLPGFVTTIVGPFFETWSTVGAIDFVAIIADTSSSHGMPVWQDPAQAYYPAPAYEIDSNGRIVYFDYQPFASIEGDVAFSSQAAATNGRLNADVLFAAGQLPYSTTPSWSSAFGGGGSLECSVNPAGQVTSTTGLTTLPDLTVGAKWSITANSLSSGFTSGDDPGGAVVNYSARPSLSVTVRRHGMRRRQLNTAPPLHQRQRPDGLTGPVRSGRGTSTRQGGLYARGIL